MTVTHWRPVVLGLGVALSMLFTLPAAADPSFDCSKAKAPDEVAICANPELARLDSLVAAAYAGYQPSFQSKPKVGKLFLGDRASCGGDTACIAAVQWNALETYGGDAGWVQDFVTRAIAARAEALAGSTASVSTAMPTRPAQCVRTRIKEVTTRFGNPLTEANAGDGIYVAYENGGGVNSYDRGPEFKGVAAGQPAVLCLVTIPRDCPAGDDRGRVYYTLDLATRGAWLTPDSEHSCGGA